jgi:hypothetical protein
MSVSSNIIVDPERLEDLEEDLDDFVCNWSNSPFLLSAFLKKSLESVRSTNGFPAVIIVKVDEKIVGLASLSIKRFSGISYANSMLGWWATPDIILSKDYSQIAVNTIFRTVFEKLRCRFAMTYLPDPYSYFQNLMQTRKSQKKHFILDTEPSISHAVVQVDRSWDDFLKFRGRYFQKDLRAIERKLNKAGEWKLSVFQNNDRSYDQNSVYEKIMAVERLSWKQVYRQKEQEGEVDSQLKWLLDSAKHFEDDTSPVKLKIWFLELNSQPIAFTSICDFKGTAFIIKTSYAERFKNLSPGFFINNSAIKDLFDKREVEKIDFLSSNSLVNQFRPNILPRMRLTLGDLSGISLVKARMLAKRGIDILEHSYETWPYNSTAQTQMKKIRRPLNFRRILMRTR